MKFYNFPIEDRLAATSNIKQVHAVILRMLKVLNMICNAHKIDFWLDYGTLLGAVRHNGFIPWDDEADIGILRKDYERFLDVAEELPDDIFFQTKITDPFYERSSHYIEAKLRDKFSNYIEFERSNPDVLWHNGIQIDFFVYDTFKLHEEYRLINTFERTLTDGKSYLKIDEIQELEECEFEDTTFFIPTGYDSYLKRNYGDYLLLPPISERRSQEVHTTLPCRHKETLIWDKT